MILQFVVTSLVPLMVWYQNKKLNNLQPGAELIRLLNRGIYHLLKLFSCAIIPTYLHKGWPILYLQLQGSKWYIIFQVITLFDSRVVYRISSEMIVIWIFSKMKVIWVIFVHLIIIFNIMSSSIEIWTCILHECIK